MDRFKKKHNRLAPILLELDPYGQAFNLVSQLSAHHAIATCEFYAAQSQTAVKV